MHIREQSRRTSWCPRRDLARCEHPSGTWTLAHLCSAQWNLCAPWSHRVGDCKDRPGDRVWLDYSTYCCQLFSLFYARFLLTSVTFWARITLGLTLWARMF